jgi:hypothetical protein
MTTHPISTIEYVERPPPGWFVLDVMRKKARSRDWVALLVDVDPGDPGAVPNASCWFAIPGKHRDSDAAWETLETMMATRH